MAETKKKAKSPTRIAALKAKINAAKRKLEEIKQYKQIMAAEGVKPDIADKERESKLIVQLLRHEKELAALEGRPVEKRRGKAKTYGKKSGKKSFKKKAK